MASQKAFVWSRRTQTGVGLFGVSLIYLVVVAPNPVAISFAVGAGACLALYGITGSRFWLTLVTLLMLSVAGCALSIALLLGSYMLVPVAVAQIVAMLFLEGAQRDDWISTAADESGAGNGLTAG